MANNYAYELNDLQSSDLIEGILVAIQENHLKNFRMAGTKIRDLIHGIPSSFSKPDFSVSQMEVYLGCARVDTLHQRFASHQKNKNHQYGLIVGACHISQVGFIEKTGIRLLKKLNNAKKLCVANYSVIGYPEDKKNKDEIILLYLTWGVDRRISDVWNGPNINEREMIYRELLRESRDDLHNQPNNWRDHIREVVDEIHKKTAKEKVYWARVNRKAA